ncbi:MAG: hypothetical protein ACFE95_01060 [Candidatus Hodarchaeota archaeon]
MSRGTGAEIFSGVSLSDIERIDLKITVKRGIASIFGKVYLNERFDIRVFGFESKFSENNLPIYLEKMEREVSESGIEFKYLITKWRWLWSLEKAMWLANSGELLSGKACPACVLMDRVFFE